MFHHSVANMRPTSSAVNTPIASQTASTSRRLPYLSCPFCHILSSTSRCHTLPPCAIPEPHSNCPTVHIRRVIHGPPPSRPFRSYFPDGSGAASSVCCATSPSVTTPSPLSAVPAATYGAAVPPSSSTNRTKTFCSTPPPASISRSRSATTAGGRFTRVRTDPSDIRRLS